MKLKGFRIGDVVRADDGKCYMVVGLKMPDGVELGRIDDRDARTWTERADKLTIVVDNRHKLPYPDVEFGYAVIHTGGTLNVTYRADYHADKKAYECRVYLPDSSVYLLPSCADLDEFKVFAEIHYNQLIEGLINGTNDASSKYKRER